jgi:hypothetical protein
MNIDRVSLGLCAFGIGVLSFVSGYVMRAESRPQISVWDSPPLGQDPDKYPSVKFDFNSIDEMSAFMEVFNHGNGFDFGPNGSFAHARSVDVDLNFFSAPPCEEGKIKFYCEGK